MTKKLSTDLYIPALRAIDEWRRGLGITVRKSKGGALFVFPAEHTTKSIWLRFTTLPQTKITLLITSTRAQSLGISKLCTKIDVTRLDFKAMMALADPTHEQMPFSTSTVLPLRNASQPDEALLTLAKHASLLPALLVIEGNNAKNLMPTASHTLSFPALKRYISALPAQITETARARLPIDHADDAYLISFHVPMDGTAHLALVVGDITHDKAPLIRIHSSCITGDLLGSLRCDCGDQLRMAVSAIAKEGCGVLLYLNQEGRGIGITNKLRAYRLQEMGYDTYEANRMLGFDNDERDFSIAAAILKQLGLRRIRMLTNNPHKIKILKSHGIATVKRIPLLTPAGKHNRTYLAAKNKSGHQF